MAGHVQSMHRNVLPCPAGLIAALPQLVCLRLECLDDSAEHCASLDLPAVLHSDALSQLEISGNVGVSEVPHLFSTHCLPFVWDIYPCQGTCTVMYMTG